MNAWLKMPLPMRVGILSAILALLIIVAFPAKAIEPGWYSPLNSEGRGTGQGIFIRCNLQDECAAAWLTYADGQSWFVSMENCNRADSVCNFAFARTAGQWFGQDFEFGPVEVTAEFEQTGDSILVDFDARRLFPEKCDTGSGGLILNDCIGVKEFFLIAR